MTVQRQPPIEIPFGGGPDEATGRLLRTPGAMRVVENCDHTKAGYLRKRRGYRLLDLERNTQGELLEQVFCAVATYRGELVILGTDNLHGVHADTAIVGGHSVTTRGPSMVGNWRRVDIAATSMGE